MFISVHPFKLVALMLTACWINLSLIEPMRFEWHFAPFNVQEFKALIDNENLARQNIQRVGIIPGGGRFLVKLRDEPEPRLVVVPYCNEGYVFTRLNAAHIPAWCDEDGGQFYFEVAVAQNLFTPRLLKKALAGSF